ncbi:MAG TPA: cupin domain-containing protein [Gemmatimonadales bacterium]|jgi:quercetin dioxygenase-like cupin family protein|nr:cupin domain-containing protein [Gemmatimonadales bacterium]
MSAPDGRLRPHPSNRLTGPVVSLDLPALARALRAEPHPARDGHRQEGLIHRGRLRIVLFTFDAGGRLPDHRAPGHVVIQCLRGKLEVAAGDTSHHLDAGGVLVLDPAEPHSVEAPIESDMLLTVCMD